MDFKTSDDIYKSADIIAEIALLKSNEGGLTEGVEGIFRPLFRVQGIKVLTSVDVQFTKDKKVNPGENTEATLRILYADGFKECLTEGLEFELCEGKQLVARGVIKELINQSLRLT